MQMCFVLKIFCVKAGAAGNIRETTWAESVIINANETVETVFYFDKISV